MIIPSALNVLIVGAMMIIFGFLWRMGAAMIADRPLGQAMAVCI